MKKKAFYIIILILIGQSYIFANEELRLSGIYQGENIYVINPFGETGAGFCIYEIIVNGEISTDEINSNAFEIDLSMYGFDIGNKIEIIIKYKDNCQPKILNPEVLNPKSTFKIISINVTKNGTLSWTTTNESGELPFIIEQYKWNKWSQIATIQGKGTNNLNKYSCKINFNTGQNKFRIRQKDDTNKSRYSPEVTYKNLSAPITFTPGNTQKTSDYITFSAITNYEIFDYYGKLELKGRKDKVSVRSLKKGTYFINYDNKTETFIKK